jgi:hypothetical protein
MEFLSRKDFNNLNLDGIALFHGMKTVDFINEVYPTKLFLKESTHFYQQYVAWCVGKTPLGKLI